MPGRRGARRCGFTRVEVATTRPSAQERGRERVRDSLKKIREITTIAHARLGTKVSTEEDDR
jgi:hypothetical protein